ncbi:MAG TPA: phosphodiester glycosidase family protein [Candidatus Methylomirabilis sp.]|nr:phosphodiester glycosidase family protein [Candidatus Methylomirabilis sp.]
MKRTFYFLGAAAVFALALLAAGQVQAATLAEQLSGRIVLDVDMKGEAWYINPADLTRYYLGRPADAFAVMRQLGVGISEGNFQKIAQSGTSASGNLALARQLSGKIILEVEKNGEAWYVYPVNLKKYYLGRPADAFGVMRQLGLGITHANLMKIPRAFKDDAANAFSNYKYQEKISTPGGDLHADVVEIALGKLNMKVVSDTAGVDNCVSGCPSKPLLDYVYNQQAFAAINGVAAAPFYNTLSKRMINENRLSSAGPLIAFDENNKFYYFSPASQFSSANFSTTYGVKLSAAFAGRAKLVEKGVIKNTAADARMARNAFGFKAAGTNPEGTVFLFSLRNGTSAELARVAKALGCDYAVELDGGSSSALFYHTEYKIGPNSNIPNAILFALK